LLARILHHLCRLPAVHVQAVPPVLLEHLERPRKWQQGGHCLHLSLLRVKCGDAVENGAPELGMLHPAGGVQLRYRKAIHLLQPAMVEAPFPGDAHRRERYVVTLAQYLQVLLESSHRNTQFTFFRSRLQQCRQRWWTACTRGILRLARTDASALPALPMQRCDCHECSA
jgi:hypothetical protein